MNCWEEYFCKHFNTKFPRDENVLQSIPDPPTTDTDSEPFTIEEVEKAACQNLEKQQSLWMGPWMGQNIAAETILRKVEMQ